MEEILKKLNDLEISYELIEHKPVYNMEEMDELGTEIFKGAAICKNLFLRDQKGKRHFLITMTEERLKKYLGLIPGAVTPLGIINDETKAVEVILDKDLFKEEKIGVHPGVNTATVIITPNDLEKYIRENGNKLKISVL